MIPLDRILPLPDDYEIDVAEYEEIKELAASMKEQGLLHPIQVRVCHEKIRNNIVVDTEYKIVAGRKRLAAARMLDWKEIAADVKDLTDEEAVEVSLHENIKRKNLTWYERAELLALFHEHKQSTHGAAPVEGGRPKEGHGPEGWGLRDTAEALGVGLGSLSESINLAVAVRGDPSLRNIKDKRSATRLVRNAAKRMEAEAESGAADIMRTFELDQVMLGSSADILTHIPPNTFDACITDPPWLKFHGEKDLEKDDETFPVFKALYPTLKNNAFVYVFIGFDDLAFYKREMVKIGYKVSKVPLVWHKLACMSRLGVRGWEYGRDIELILVAVKGEPILTTPSQMSTVVSHNIVPPKHMIHPHEKPIDLLRRLIVDSTFEGNAIVDPFAGSGAVGVACAEKKRRYYLIEREKKFYDGIVRRLQS
jgi:ParB/RepB/Spo0J family partition protein